MFALAALSALYAELARGRIPTWGATEVEAASRLPGDELLENADGVSTRAIWIEAPAAAVWPWLARGLGMHSVDWVLPEYQHPQIGDSISLGSNRMLVERVDPQHVLAWRSEDGNWVWTFVVENRAGRTRLISRNRFRLAPFKGSRSRAIVV